MDPGTLLAVVTHSWQTKMDARLRGDTRMRPYRLSISKWNALLQLRLNPEGLSQRQLASLLCVEGATTVSLIDAMEVSGLVERQTCPDDRRVRIIRLLPPGDFLATVIEEHVNAAWAEILQSLGAEQTEQIQKSLAHILRTLETLSTIRR